MEESEYITSITPPQKRLPLNFNENAQETVNKSNLTLSKM